jgi:hypothetical protein
VTVENKLTSGAAARRKTKTIDDVVKTHFKLLEQKFTGDAFLAQSFLEEATELKFTHAILTAERLLLTKLRTVFRHLTSTTTNVHTGSSGTLFDRALGHIATCALEEELLPFAAAQTTNGTSVTTHN